MHYMNRDHRTDPRDKIGVAYRSVYQCGLMLQIKSEQLENLLREKNGLEPRRSRSDKIRDDNPTADPEELEVQFKRERERVLGGDIIVLS